MKSTGKRILGALLALCVAMGLMGILPLVATAFVIVDVVITDDLSVADIQTLIQDKLDRAVVDSLLTVNGAKTDADETLTLRIPAGVEVIWMAVYTNAVAAEPDPEAEPETTPEEVGPVNPLINLTGAGTFEVAAPANIANSSGWAIYSDVDVLVSGGAVASTADDCGAISADKNVKVTGGAVSGDRAIDGTTVEAAGGTVTGGAFAIQATGAVTVSGGTVAGEGKGINAGGAVTVSGTAAISGADAIISGGAVTVSGGTITGETSGIKATGAVEISGGNIAGKDAVASAAFTISAGTVTGETSAVTVSGTVAVSGGTVKATNGTAVTTPARGEAVTVSGGAVIGTYRAIDAKNADLVVSGGAVSSNAVAVDVAGATVSGGSITGVTTGILSKGSVLMTGGAVSAGNGPYNRAIAFDSGTVKVTGGTITGATAIDNLGQYGAVAYKPGTVVGPINIKSVGAVVQVTEDNIPGAYNGTANALVVDYASYKSSVAWKFVNNVPELDFSLYLRQDRRYALRNPNLPYDATTNPRDVPTNFFDDVFVDPLPVIPWGTIILPVISNESVSRSAGAAGETAGTLRFNTTVAGELYALFLAPGALAPDAAAILDAPLLANVSAGAVNLPLTLDYQAKDIYFILVDALGNKSNIGAVSQSAFALQYSLTVVNGSGSASYAPGELATFSTTVPAKKVFVGWTASNNVPIDDANALEASLIMPGNNVTVTANFIDEDDLPVPKYVRFFQWETKYESNFWNWFKFIVLFGWIWMWFL